MLRWQFKDAAAKGLVTRPHDRSVEARKLIESVGGKMHQHFFALGDFDGLAICEFPDHKAAAAASLVASATGGYSNVQTTPLLTPAEAEEATKHANAHHGKFAAPHH
jgi:uncharacterized protein with GYD domain